MSSAWRLRNMHTRFNKENVEQQTKVEGVDVVMSRKVTSPRAKSRKNSDSTDDRLQRAKGLQVAATNILNNVPPRRRIQPSSDASTTKPWVKTRVCVYEEKSEEANQPTERRNIFKLGEAPKPLVSIYHEKCVPRTLIVREEEQQKDDQKSSNQTTYQKKSPKNLPIISKPDVCNIKEKHNNRSLQRKTPKKACEALSLEMAYNLDYMPQYIRYQMEIGEKKNLSSTFLRTGVTADQRRLIVKYLIDSTTYYKSPSFILYQSVKIFDSYIDKMSVSLYELQTVALAALWIALKKDLIIDDVPEIERIMKLAADGFKGDKTPLLDCEKKILMMLKFEIYYADPFSMLALYAIMIEEVRELESATIQELYYCGSYLMDLSMLDEDLCNVSALHLAEICTEVALVLVMTNSDNIKDARWKHWRTRILESNPLLEEYVLPDREMTSIRDKLLKKAVLSKDKTTDFYAVFKKYCTKRYGTISVFLTNKISSLYVSRNIDPNNGNRPMIF